MRTIVELGGYVEYESQLPQVLEEFVRIDFIARVRTVYFFDSRRGHSELRFRHVYNLEPIIDAVKRLPSVESISILEYNHGDWVTDLEHAFPGVAIKVCPGGII